MLALGGGRSLERGLCPNLEFTDYALIRDKKDTFEAMRELKLSSSYGVGIGVSQPIVV